jgi:hypothetical protein
MREIEVRLPCLSMKRANNVGDLPGFSLVAAISEAISAVPTRPRSEENSHENWIRDSEPQA